jgi:hypothetical protein
MGNESRSRKAYLELKKIALELDPARPVTYAENHIYRARRAKTVGIPDVWSINYELDVLDEARDSSTLENVIISECCNFPLSIKGDDGAELTQVATLEYEWNLMEGRPFLAGHAVWAFTDYATEHRKRYRRQPGLFDAWRRPKMAAELYRARYSERPFVSPFLTGPANERRLHIFTNCQQLRVFRDGAAQAELGPALHHVVDLAGEFSEIVVEGRQSGTKAYEMIRNWGEAAAVVISFDETEVRPGKTAAIDLSILDASGVPVRDWNGRVALAVEGDGLHLPYTETGDVVIARGEGRTFVKIGRSGGEIVFQATGDGLEQGNLKASPRP